MRESDLLGWNEANDYEDEGQADEFAELPAAVTDPGFPVACSLMHEHDPVDCAPEAYPTSEVGIRLFDLADRAAGLSDADGREVLRGLLFELSGVAERDWSPALVASLADRFLAGEPGLPGAVTHHPHVLDQGRAVSGYPDGWAADQLAWMLRRLARQPLGDAADLVARIDAELAVSE